MARNGTGTYVLPAGQPVVTATTISSTVFNLFGSDVATALTTSICTDGQTPMAANLSMGNFKINNLATATLASDAARFDQVPTNAAIQALILGTFNTRGLTGTENAGTPLTKYDLAADVVVLKNSSNAINVQTGVSVTCDLGLAGSAANGRDQAAAFAINSWIYLYFIWNGTATASVASLTGPATGPTLPSGYTHWCYAGVIRWNGSSNIVPGQIRGNTFYYTNQQVALNNGTATVETGVTITSFVPPGASSYFGYILVQVTASGGGVGINSPNFRIVTAITALSLSSQAATSQTIFTNATFEFSNKNNTLFYLNVVSGSPTTATSSININGYRLANGA